VINPNANFQPLHSTYRPSSQPTVPAGPGKKETTPTQLWRSAEDRRAYISRGGKYADLIEKDIFTWGFRDGRLFRV
jgi:hypothetical protein